MRSCFEALAEKKMQWCNQISIWMISFKITAFLIFKIKCMHARAFFILLFASIYNTGSSSVLVWIHVKEKVGTTRHTKLIIPKIIWPYGQLILRPAVN